MDSGDSGSIRLWFGALPESETNRCRIEPESEQDRQIICGHPPRILPEWDPNEICRGHIREFWGYSAGFEHFKTSRIPPRMFPNPSRLFAHSRKENRMLPNPREYVYSGGFWFGELPESDSGSSPNQRRIGPESEQNRQEFIYSSWLLPYPPPPFSENNNLTSKIVNTMFSCLCSRTWNALFDNFMNNQKRASFVLTP